MIVDLEISTPGDGRAPGDLAAYLTLQARDSSSLLKQGKHTRNVVSASGVRATTLLRDKYLRDVDALEKEVVAAGELVAQYRHEVLLLHDKCAEQQRALDDHAHHDRGASASRPTTPRKQPGAPQGGDSIVGQRRQKLQSRARIAGAGPGVTDHDLLLHVSDLRIEADMARRICNQVKDKNAALTREKTRLLDRLREASSAVRRLESEVAASQAKLQTYQQQAGFSTPAPGRTGGGDTPYHTPLLTPGSAFYGSSPGTAIKGGNSAARVPRLALAGAESGRESVVGGGGEGGGGGGVGGGKGSAAAAGHPNMDMDTASTDRSAGGVGYRGYGAGGVSPEGGVGVDLVITPLVTPRAVAPLSAEQVRE